MRQGRRAWVNGLGRAPGCRAGPARVNIFWAAHAGRKEVVGFLCVRVFMGRRCNSFSVVLFSAVIVSFYLLSLSGIACSSVASSSSPVVRKGLTPKEKVALEHVVSYIKNEFKGDAQKAFEKFDGSKDGIADETEIRALFQESGLGDYFKRKSWIKRVADKLDLDKDGKLTVQELHGASSTVAPIQFKLTEACYDAQCIARTGPRTKHRV